VSLYNEGSEGPIYPTPIVGMVGKLPDPATVPGMGFREEGHEVALVGPFRPDAAGSELEKLSGGLADRLPRVDLAEHARGLEMVRDVVRSGLVASVHDIAEGGLGVALAECCIAAGLGAQVELAEGFPLFGEGPGGFVVSGPAEALAEVERRASGVGFQKLGQVSGDRLVVAGSTASLALPVADLMAAFESGIPAKFS
jgi:phosphoribosylformylglycinamidine synthase subunit PurL